LRKVALIAHSTAYFWQKRKEHWFIELPSYTLKPNAATEGKAREKAYKPEIAVY
jgi:hypothetical protein